MKYPVVTIKRPVSLFKHGAKAYVFHIDYDEKEKQDTMAMMKYKDFLLKEVCTALENQFVANQATAVKTNSGYFVLFKESVDLRMMESFAKGLISNLDECLEHKECFHYAILKAMIMEEGKTPGMFTAHQVGEDILESQQYQKAKVKADPSSYNSKVNYLTTYDRFEKEQQDDLNMYYI